MKKKIYANLVPYSYRLRFIIERFAFVVVGRNDANRINKLSQSCASQKIQQQQKFIHKSVIDNYDH